MRAVASSDPSKLSGSPLEAFLGTHPKALEFVQTPKPAPSSFAREAYFGVTAMWFTNSDGVSRYGRYRIIPEAGNDYLDADSLSSKGADYLFDELTLRISREPIKFRMFVQLADESDVVDDATVHWPADRPLFDLGTLALTKAARDDDPEIKRIIFDPIPRVDGIEPSADPLLELRAAIYLLSGRRRRSAAQTAKN